MANSLVDLISEKAAPLVGSPNDFDPVIDLIGDARFVLLGEATQIQKYFNIMGSVFRRDRKAP